MLFATKYEWISIYTFIGDPFVSKFYVAKLDKACADADGAKAEQVK